MQASDQRLHLLLYNAKLQIFHISSETPAPYKALALAGKHILQLGIKVMKENIV